MSLIKNQAKTRGYEINTFVRDLRSLCGLTQEQFAAKLGGTLVTVNRWENDRTKPMPLSLRQLKVLLMDMSKSEIEADQESARLLLTQYFPKDC